MGAPSVPDLLPVLPLRDTVTFPDTLTPLAVGQERSIQLVNDVLARDRQLVMVGSKDPEAEAPGPGQLYRVGVVGTVARMLKVPDGTLRILVQGGQRVNIEAWDVGGALPRRPHLRRAGHRRGGRRADGADAQRPADVLAHHRRDAVSARGAADGGRQHRRPLRALAPDRRLAADQDRGEAGAARGARRRQAAAAALPDPRARARGRRHGRADPVAGPVRARQVPARLPAARAAQGDPGGARRARPGRGRGRGAARAAGRDRPARGGAQGRRPRALAAGEAAAGGRRARRDPHLPGVDRLAAVGHARPRTTSTSSTRASSSTPTTTTSSA